MKSFTIILATLALGAMATPIASPEAEIANAIAARDSSLSARDVLQKRACGQCSNGSQTCWVCGPNCHYWIGSC
ncbi:hypothetical protein ACHAQA_006740 [Verticillium albo-atrum]